MDLELRGCPIDKGQLLEALGALLVGRKPHLPNHSQCMDCKMSGTVCIMVAKGEPCLGPICHAGCGNICPSFARGCYGCFGPKEMANVAVLSERLGELGLSKKQRADLLHTFNTAAFSKAENDHG